MSNVLTMSFPATDLAGRQTAKVRKYINCHVVRVWSLYQEFWQGLRPVYGTHEGYIVL